MLAWVSASANNAVRFAATFRLGVGHPGGSAVTITALVGGAVAIAMSLRRQRSTERTVELSASAARITAKAYELDQSRAQFEVVDRLRDRYTTIAGQLGNDAAP